jgi:hypothetical protein
MKLSEALILRADVQKRLNLLRQRLSQNALIQEGTRPSEEPKALLKEMDRLLSELGFLIKRINHTNAMTPFDQGRTLTDALADRDTLNLEHSLLVGLAQSAVVTHNRYSRSEVKYLSTISVAEVQKRAESLARRIRELDTRIQETNWHVELVE